MNWDYIAGFFDGEGCVTVCSSRCAVVKIAQSTPGASIFAEIKNFLAFHGIRSFVQPRKVSGNRRPQFQLSISERESVRNFLVRIFPLVKVKKVIVQDALRTMLIFPVVSRNRRKLPINTRTLRLDRAAGMSWKQLATKHGMSKAGIRNRLLYHKKWIPMTMFYL